MKQIFAIVLGLAVSATSIADAHQTDGGHEAEIRQHLKHLPVESVKQSPIPGLYEVIIGGQIVYFSADARYLIEGDIVDYKQRVNLTEKVRNRLSAQVFKKMGKDDYIAFAPEGETKYVLNVFTDVDCGYCRKLHREVPKLNAKGVEVRYFLYPRAGMKSRSAKTLESIWCADDRQEAMNLAKLGQKIASKTCDNPIGDHVALATQVGLTGTPLIFTGGGQRISGYRSADALHAQLLSEAAADNQDSAE